METLVVYKALPLPIFKVNIETLRKFDTLVITWCQRHCILILITILQICTSIESIDDNQVFDSNDEEEDRVELGNTLPQEILEDQKVTNSRDCILIATVFLCILYYARNQHLNIL